MFRGPKEYVPPVEVEVVMKRQAIPLDENEGIYVRDVKTGKVTNTRNLTLKLLLRSELINFMRKIFEEISVHILLQMLLI